MHIRPLFLIFKNNLNVNDINMSYYIKCKGFAGSKYFLTTLYNRFIYHIYRARLIINTHTYPQTMCILIYIDVAGYSEPKHA